MEDRVWEGVYSRFTLKEVALNNPNYILNSLIENPEVAFVDSVIQNLIGITNGVFTMTNEAYEKLFQKYDQWVEIEVNEKEDEEESKVSRRWNIADNSPERESYYNENLDWDQQGMEFWNTIG